MRPKVKGMTRRLVWADDATSGTTTFLVEYKDSGFVLLYK